MGTHLRVLCESFPININIMGFRKNGFQNMFASLCFRQSSLSIGRVKKLIAVVPVRYDICSINTLQITLFKEFCSSLSDHEGTPDINSLKHVRCRHKCLNSTLFIIIYPINISGEVLKLLHLNILKIQAY